MINQPEIDDLGASPYLDLLSTSVLKWLISFSTEPNLGAQEPWRSFPLGTPCSFECAALPGHTLRPREARAAGRRFNFWVAEEAPAEAAATDFVLEMGLLGALGANRDGFHRDDANCWWANCAVATTVASGFQTASMYWKSTNDIQSTLW